MSLESENDLLKEITDNGANISPILPENIKKDKAVIKAYLGDWYAKNCRFKCILRIHSCH